MQLYITPEHLDELTTAQQHALRDWWKDCLEDGFEVIGNKWEHPHLLE